MYEKLIGRCVDFIFAYGDPSEEKRDIYRYGMELIVMYIINAGTLLLLGLIIGRFLQTLLILIVLALLQSFGGGYHAMTHLRCLLLMLIFWAAALYLIPIAAGSPILTGLFAFIGLITVFVIAPVKHKNYPLSPEKEKKMKKTVRYITVFLTAAVLLFEYFIPQGNVAAIIGTTMFLTAISMISSFVKQKMQKSAN